MESSDEPMEPLLSHPSSPEKLGKSKVSEAVLVGKVNKWSWRANDEVTLGSAHMISSIKLQ